MEVEKSLCPVAGKYVLITKKYWIHKSSGTKHVTAVYCEDSFFCSEYANQPSKCIVRNNY
ncbi:hypothetical protein SAMN06295933_1238 [Desulfovibrio gilichinskyi]|uniref:Uncharacterized protein n=1 Tax=Desulfovibrio gilichinskyi TaxID=1519643 RepID=A0A1X7CTV5_9BACT|nr:hypothetical protein SAMN06295933_1238 [Desulfovibrio gilichinskyi]